MPRFGYLFTILLLVGTLLLGCSNKCEELLCSTGPASLNILFIDKESGADVFQTGRYSPDDLQLSEASAKIADLFIQEEESYPAKVILSFKINEGEQEIEIQLGDEIIHLNTAVSIHKSECCSNSFLDAVSSTSHSFSSSYNTVISIEL